MTGGMIREREWTLQSVAVRDHQVQLNISLKNEMEEARYGRLRHSKTESRRVNIFRTSTCEMFGSSGCLYGDAAFWEDTPRSSVHG